MCFRIRKGEIYFYYASSFRKLHRKNNFGIFSNIIFINNKNEMIIVFHKSKYVIGQQLDEETKK